MVGAFIAVLIFRALWMFTIPPAPPTSCLGSATAVGGGCCQLFWLAAVAAARSK